MRISGRTIAYAAVMGVILIAVAILMTRIARTDEADRRLLTIAAVIVGVILIGGLGLLRFRRRSPGRDANDESEGEGASGRP